MGARLIHVSDVCVDVIDGPEVEVAVGEPALDPLLKQLCHVDTAGDAEYGDGDGARLGHVKQVIQQSLILVQAEGLEVIQNEYYGFTAAVASLKRCQEE